MRVLFFVQPGQNSRSIMFDMMAGFRAAGHECLVIELEPIWRHYDQAPAQKPARMSAITEQIVALMKREKPDLSIAMWANAMLTLMGIQRGASGGRIETVFDDLGIPHVLYWLDAPHWLPGPREHGFFGHPIMRAPALLHVVNHGAMARELERVLRFGRSVGVPYGVNPEVFKPMPNRAGGRRFEVVMNVGPGDPPPTAGMEQALTSEDPDWEEIRATTARDIAWPRLKAMASGAADEQLLRRMLESQLDDRHTAMLDRMAIIEAGDETLAAAGAALRGVPRRYVDVTQVVRSIDGYERAFTACWLSRRFGVAVSGAFSAAWPFAGTRLGPLPYESLGAAYGTGLVGVNVMRWQDDQGVNIKPLEVAASGLPLVCGRRAGLDEIFEDGRECLTFDHVAARGGRGRNGAEQIRELLENPGMRERMIAAATERVRREHTWAARAGRIIEVALNAAPAGHEAAA